jgi:hypothetical protein
MMTDPDIDHRAVLSGRFADFRERRSAARAAAE